MPKTKKLTSGTEQELDARLDSGIESALEQFIGKISASLISQLRSVLKAQLKAKFRWAGVRGKGRISPELAVARQILTENNGPMWGDELLREMRRGGAYREPTKAQKAQGYSPESAIMSRLSRAGAADHGTNIMLLLGEGERGADRKLFGLPGRDDKLKGKPFPRPLL